MLSAQQFQALHNQLTDEGGFTVNMRTGKQPSSGWMVGRHDTESRFPMPGSPNDVRQHYAEHRPQIERAGHLGGWEHQGEGYLQATRRYPNTAKGMQGASRSMKHQGEQSIYEPSSDTTYWNNPRPGTPEHEQNLQATSHFLDSALKGMGQKSPEEMAQEHRRG
jgi:hypothetical protein